MGTRFQLLLRGCVPLSICVGIALEARLPAAESGNEQTARFAAAVDALHHPDFRARQQAYKSLARGGAAAAPAIEAAARAGDRETRDRAIALLLSAALSRQKDAVQAGRQALEQLAAANDDSLRRIAGKALEQLQAAKAVRAIEEIQARGGTVTSTTGVDLDLEGPFAIQIGSQWSGGDEGLSLLADLGNVTWLSLHTAPITNAGLVHLERLQALEQLYLGYSRVTGEGLARLELPKLRVLSLHGLAVKDADLERLPELPHLQELVLNSTLVTDEGLVHLAKHASIHKLWLEQTKITDKGLVHLQRLPGLETLYLQETLTAGPGLADLKPLSNLRFISFKRVTLRPDSLRHVAQLTQLEILGLDDTNVTDEQLAELTPLRNLRTLWLSKTRVTDRGAEHILKLPALQDLYLHGSQITEAGADRIREQLPRCNVGR
jgi:Leucine Rich repeat